MTNRDTKTPPPASAVPPAAAPGQPAGSNSERWDAEDGEQWRHPPIAPKDANPLDSLGRAVSDAITGSEGSLEEARNKNGKP